MRSFAALGNDLYTGKTSFDFVRRWRRLLALGVILVVASVLVVAIKGLNHGIEFRGGSEFTVSGTSSTDVHAGEQAVSSVAPGAQQIVLANTICLPSAPGTPSPRAARSFRSRT